MLLPKALLILPWTSVYLHQAYLYLSPFSLAIFINVFSSPNCIDPFPQISLWHCFCQKANCDSQTSGPHNHFCFMLNYMPAHTSAFLKCEIFSVDMREPSLPPHKHLASETSALFFALSFLLTWLCAGCEILSESVPGQHHHCCGDHQSLPKTGFPVIPLYF